MSDTDVIPFRSMAALYAELDAAWYAFKTVQQDRDFRLTEVKTARKDLSNQTDRVIELESRIGRVNRVRYRYQNDPEGVTAAQLFAELCEALDWRPATKEEVA